MSWLRPIIPLPPCFCGFPYETSDPCRLPCMAKPCGVASLCMYVPTCNLCLRRTGRNRLRRGCPTTEEWASNKALQSAGIWAWDTRTKCLQYFRDVVFSQVIFRETNPQGSKCVSICDSDRRPAAMLQVEPKNMTKQRYVQRLCLCLIQFSCRADTSGGASFEFKR